MDQQYDFSSNRDTWSPVANFSPYLGEFMLINTRKLSKNLLAGGAYRPFVRWRSVGLWQRCTAAAGLVAPAGRRHGKRWRQDDKQPGTIVNRYAVLSAAAAPGDKTITLSATAGLGIDALCLWHRTTLLLIIQMQGADIDTSNSASYGSVIDLRSAGRYEFIGVTSIDAASQKNHRLFGLRRTENGYDPSGHVQVIRVPQYKNLTVSSGASIVAPAWNGQTGGVVALQVSDGVTLDGTIDVSGLGFRGGQRNPNTKQRTAGIGTTTLTECRRRTNRGEGIAGYVTEYALSGQYGRGAAANGGGGGNRIAAGGGGGGGGGDVSQWNGQGVMSTTVTGGAAAWLLDPGYDANKTMFAGGGRGGYTYSTATLDPTMVAPGK